jgi:hypothetical protein
MSAFDLKKVVPIVATVLLCCLAFVSVVNGADASTNSVRTYVHYPHGKLVGWVERGDYPREWGVSNDDNSYISADRKGGYALYKGTPSRPTHFSVRPASASATSPEAVCFYGRARPAGTSTAAAGWSPSRAVRMGSPQPSPP